MRSAEDELHARRVRAEYFGPRQETLRASSGSLGSMSRLALVVILSLVLGCGNEVFFHESEVLKAWRERGEAPWPEFDAQRAQIAEELARGGAPTWAGTFEASDHASCGMGSDTVTIELAPGAGIVWRRGGGLGTRRDRGTVTRVDGGWITVAWDYPADRSVLPLSAYREKPELSERLWLSTWGDREFLVPECDLAGFVNLVNRGGELYEAFAFRFVPGRAPDAALDLEACGRRRPTGTPTLPDPWAARVRSAPLVANVTDVQRSVLMYRERDDRFNQYEQQAEIDRGVVDGVFEGMELFVEGRTENVTVVRCGEREASIRLVYFGQGREPGVIPIERGSRLTSDRR